MSLYDFLMNYSEKPGISFHMPGHKGSRFFASHGYGEYLKRIADLDITEIPGADNLFQAEDVILEIMERYRKIYESRKSYLLVNGSSTGLIASLMSACPEGGKVIMARNSHKSVFNGLAMIGAEPVYAFPEYMEEYGITGEITAAEIERCIAGAPDASCVILPSPNYYGILSDIEGIARACHDAGLLLIVDQAHGAHLKFFDDVAAHKSGSANTGEAIMQGCEMDEPVKLSAEAGGADFVINSTHKTLSSFTQSAVLNIMSDRVDLDRVEDALQKMQSTSPSYILMSSLDIASRVIEDEKEALFNSWNSDLDFFYSESSKIPGLKLVRHQRMDRTKLDLDMGALGIDGHMLEEELMKRNIIPEAITGNVVVMMTGIGNEREDYEALLTALTEIAVERKASSESDAAVLPKDMWNLKETEQHPIPKSKETVLIDDAEGRICAQAVIPYPPGIPILCPGEVYTRELIDQLKTLRDRGENVIGVSSEGFVVVGKRQED